jgi:VWFA-related protein
MILSRQIWLFLLCLPAMAMAQQAPPAPVAAEGAPQAKSPDPVLIQRPAPKPESTEGRVQLDIVVVGKQGNPVPGLDEKDFTVLDNKKSQTILSFHAPDQAPARPVEVILLLDLVNSSFEQASITRTQIAKFLQQNGGHLAYPTLIAVLSDDGLRIQPHPATDGNALAGVLARAGATAHTTGLGEAGRFQLSVRTLASIAENAARTSGRKMLIWTGPGWPMLVGSHYAASSQDRERTFDTIVEISNRLREAHLVLDSVSPSNAAKGATPSMPASTAYVTSPNEGASMSRPLPAMHDEVDGSNYKAFLRGVKSARDADSSNLALQVLAVQSGGRVLDPSNDVAGQISRCIDDLGAYYTITFNPDPSHRSDEYHELKVQIAKPGLVARTSTGYYERQP